MSDIEQAVHTLFNDIVSLNVEAVINRYAHDDNLYVHLEGPRWTNRGFENVAKGWRAFFDSPLRMLNIEWVEGPLTQHSGTLGYIAGGSADSLSGQRPSRNAQAARDVRHAPR